MRILSLCALLAVLAAAAGCLAEKPLSVSDFRGNCYQSNVSRKADCDSISVCEAYATVLETAVADRETCFTECKRIHGRLYMQHLTGGCGPVVDAGSDWCNRFCRTNYAGPSN